MGDSIANVYSDARTEYTKQLCGILIPSYFQFYLTVLEKAREESTKLNDPKKLLWHFQTLLNEIPEWNMEKVNTEIAQLQGTCGCDYLEDLLTAVFIAHTKVLTAIRVSAKQKKVQITVPKVEHFLFKVLCETSKLLWGSSFLFRENITAIEKQQNYRSVETLLGEGILQAVRAMVPVKNILRDFVSMDDDVDTKEDEKEEEVKVDASKNEVVTPVGLPGVGLPGVGLPGVGLPGVGLPGVGLPDVGLPADSLAKVELPDVGLPADSLAKVELPEVGLAKIELPAADSLAKVESSIDTSGSAPLIRLDIGANRVGFAEYNSMFDTTDDGTNMVRGSEDDDHEGGIEILEEEGVPLTTDDFDSLGDSLDGKDEAIGDDDYDVLS